MPTLDTQLDLDRCPHCNVDRPTLGVHAGVFATKDYKGQGTRFWKTYICSRCGGVVTAGASGDAGEISELYPASKSVDDAIPERAKSYLEQAMNSLHAPAGAIMLSASAVDAMLKDKKYVQGSLYQRIDRACDDHIITQGMAEWAHIVRLEANDQRHADEMVSLPSPKDARDSIDFVAALGQFLYVLPARVDRGKLEASGDPVPQAS